MNSFVFFYFQIFITLSLLVASIYADHPAPHHIPIPHHGPAPHHAAAHYNYAYAVNDANAYGHPLDFGHTEGRDGYATKGTYHVLLPDGRTQTVNYHVDDAYSGYIADVSYAGTPHYGPAPHHAPKYAPKPHHAY